MSKETRRFITHTTDSCMFYILHGGRGKMNVPKVERNFWGHYRVEKKYCLVNHIEACVGNQCSGNTNAVGSLVVLQEGCHDARKSQGRTIERVANLSLLVVGSAIAALQSVGLIGVEISY